MTRVSMIVSCYKASHFLEHFLNSVENQSYKNLELVIHTNETPIYEKILIEHASKLSKKIVHIEDNPVIPLYQAWNRCIEKSTGDYICIGNSDDLRTKKSVELMARVLDEKPDVDFVYGNHIAVSKFLNEEGELIDSGLYIDQLQTGMILGPFFMFRKSVLDRSGYFDEQLKSGGDYDFAMRLARVGKGFHLPEVLGYYLDEGKGLSTGSMLQPVERTVIELRYGLKVLDEKMVSLAREYDIDHLFWQGGSYSLKGFFREKTILQFKKVGSSLMGKGKKKNFFSRFIRKVIGHT